MNAELFVLLRTHAALLAVILPLAGAAAAALAGPRLAWIVAFAAMSASAACTLDLAWRTLLLGAPGVAEMGLSVDGIGAWSAAFAATASALVIVASVGVLRGDIAERAQPAALALVLVCAAGWIGACLARDLVGVFAAVETGWLACVGLVALSGERERGALTGALRMLVHGGIGAAFTLVGVAMTARAIGAVDLARFETAAVPSPALAGAGLALIFAGLGAKAGVAPFHLWVGAAFGRAGAVGAMLLGAVVTTSALALIVRIIAYALPVPAVAEQASPALMALGLLSVAAGSFQAAGARNLCRLAAYAGVAQAGCVLICAAFGSPAGYAAALVLIFAQGAASLALLGAAAALPGPPSLAALDGLARRAPLSSAAITAGALSLMGAPLTLGFLGRWRMIEAGVGGGWWWTAGAVIVASLAAVLYGGRLIERIYFRRANAVGEPDWFARGALAPALIASILAIAVGLAPALLLRAADAAATSLSGAAP